MCVTYLFQIFTHQMICVHPADAPEILHLSGRSTQTPGLFYFGFLHIPVTCASFLQVHHISIQDIYPPYYLCTFCRCSKNSAFSWDTHLHTMVVFPRFSPFFPRTIIWTPGLFFFFRFSAHPWDIYMCISYLFKTFTHQIICAHPSNALDILPFSQDIYPDTRVVFF